ncbi:MAG: glycosyl hydrolase [Candidatus Omnitrophota bacterium]
MKLGVSSLRICTLGIIIINTAIITLLMSGNSYAQCEIGAFVGNNDHVMPTNSEIQNYESLTGRNLASTLVYWSWDDGVFPAQELYANGYNKQNILHFTWEPWARQGAYDPNYTLSDINNGIFDSYITQFAQDCRDWQSPIRLRFGHEMIQDNNPITPGWYPWQDKPAEYVQAWNRVYNIFETQGAINVEFVWAPNHHSTNVNELMAYYPGADKVDWLGMDGYNWGTYTAQEPWGYWLEFEEVFGSLYDTLTTNDQIFGDKKLMIAEFASAEVSAIEGKTKAEWIANAFNKIQNDYSEIEAFYWFNALKERDWRVNSGTGETLAAFQLAMTNSYFTEYTVPEPSSIILFSSGLLGLMFNISFSNFKKTIKMKGGYKT